MPERRVEVADHQCRVVAGAAQVTELIEFALPGFEVRDRRVCMHGQDANRTGGRLHRHVEPAVGRVAAVADDRRRPRPDRQCRRRPARSARCGRGSRPPSPLPRDARWCAGRVLDEHDDVEVATAEVVSDRSDAGLVVRVEQVERGDPESRGAVATTGSAGGKTMGRASTRAPMPTADAVSAIVTTCGRRARRPRPGHRERQVRGQRLDHGHRPGAGPAQRLGEHHDAGAAHRGPADQLDEPLPAERTAAGYGRRPTIGDRGFLACADVAQLAEARRLGRRQ